MWLRRFLCALWFGHRKRYLSVSRDHAFQCTAFTHAYHGWQEYAQVARWVCDRCGAMGEKCMGREKYGTWTIVNGLLVPDEKKWANREHE